MCYVLQQHPATNALMSLKHVQYNIPLSSKLYMKLFFYFVLNEVLLCQAFSPYQLKPKLLCHKGKIVLVEMLYILSESKNLNISTCFSKK